MTAGSSTLEQNLPRALQVGNAGNGVPQFLLALQSFLAHLLHENVGSQRCPRFSLPVGSTPKAQGPPLRVARRLLGSTPVFCPHANGSLPWWRAPLQECCTASVYVHPPRPAADPLGALRSEVANTLASNSTGASGVNPHDVKQDRLNLALTSLPKFPTFWGANAAPVKTCLARDTWPCMTRSSATTLRRVLSSSSVLSTPGDEGVL